MSHLAFWLHSIWHPLQGAGYQFWSGIGSCLGYLSVAVVAYRHWNCEEPGCWRLGHRHPDHGRPVCRSHYVNHQPPKES